MRFPVARLVLTALCTGLPWGCAPSPSGTMVSSASCHQRDSGYRLSGVSENLDAVQHDVVCCRDSERFGCASTATIHPLGRGINLGNALDAPTEGAWGITLDADYFRRISQAGFDTVRLPVRWSAHATPVAPYTIAPDFFDRVDWAVDQALANGLTVVIDVHHYDELMNAPKRHRDRLLGMWAQIAEHFASRPAALAFELLNEPRGNLDAARWNTLLRDTLRVIRVSNPHRTVIVGPVDWNHIGGLASLDLPRDPSLVVTFHYYEPFHFTHQGAPWVKGSADWLGTTWQATTQQQAKIDEDFDRAAMWAASHGTKLWMGEFGCYERADMASRIRWTRFVARAAEQRGIAWAYWEFGAGFGVYDRRGAAWKTELLEALLAPSP